MQKNMKDSTKIKLYNGNLLPRWLCCCSVAHLCPTLCDPMDCSAPGFPVLHHLLKLAQTHVHWVTDAIQPSLSPPISPALKDKLKDFLNQVGTIYLCSVVKEQCSSGLWVMSGGVVGGEVSKCTEMKAHQKEWLEIRGSWWYHPSIFLI